MPDGTPAAPPRDPGRPRSRAAEPRSALRPCPWERGSWVGRTGRASRPKGLGEARDASRGEQFLDYSPLTAVRLGRRANCAANPIRRTASRSLCGLPDGIPDPVDLIRSDARFVRCSGQGPRHRIGRRTGSRRRTRRSHGDPLFHQALGPFARSLRQSPRHGDLVDKRRSLIDVLVRKAAEQILPARG